MSATITWTIEWMQASTTVINGHSEVVLTAGWRCNATQSNSATDMPMIYNATSYGSTSFPIPAEGGSFTPYDQLTQAQVLGWVWADGANRTATEEGLQTNIDAQINPPVIQPPLPWVSAPTEGA